MANNKSYEFKKLSDAEVVTQLSEGDNVIIVSDSDTKQIDHQQFIDVVEDAAMEEINPRVEKLETDVAETITEANAKVDAAIVRMEDDVLVAVKDSPSVEELPETAQVVVVDTVEDPDTGETTQTVKQVPADQFGKGGEAKWFTLTADIMNWDLYGSNTNVECLWSDYAEHHLEEPYEFMDTVAGQNVYEIEYFSFIPGKTNLYLGGTLLQEGVDYTYVNHETNPSGSDIEIKCTSTLTLVNTPQSVQKITVSGYVTVAAPLLKIFEGSDYNIPEFHVSRVSTQVFIDALKSTDYTVYLKGGWSKRYYDQGVEEAGIEIIENQMTYDISDFIDYEIPELTTVYYQGDVIPKDNYDLVYDVDQETASLTFKEGHLPTAGDKILVVVAPMFDLTTFSPFKEIILEGPRSMIDVPDSFEYAYPMDATIFTTYIDAAIFPTATYDDRAFYNKREDRGYRNNLIYFGETKSEEVVE